ncbi:MAG: hypothetical protein H6686_02955 [Fibrobacteria bacterium]|nr:hypothetical protein [Fibrobacteria bacterium]
MHDIDRTMLELESEGFDANELEGILGGDSSDELELEEEGALEFLELESSDELEEFLGGLLSRAAGALGRVARNPAVQKTIRSTLHGALSAGIPSVTGAIGKRYFGDAGATWGKRAGKSLATMMGLGEDGELEIARRIQRTVLGAARKVEPLVNQGVALPLAVRRAVGAAVAEHLPPLARASVAGASTAQSGRWIRENGRVVLLGL